MFVNLKSAKANLSRLVERASQDGEIWLTVRGKPKARLCPLLEKSAETDIQSWVDFSSDVRAKYGQQKNPEQSQALWDDLRGA